MEYQKKSSLAYNYKTFNHAYWVYIWYQLILCYFTISEPKTIKNIVKKVKNVNFAQNQGENLFLQIS